MAKGGLTATNVADVEIQDIRLFSGAGFAQHQAGIAKGKEGHAGKAVKLCHSEGIPVKCPRPVQPFDAAGDLGQGA